MVTKAQNYLEEKIIWARGVDPKYPFMARFDKENCLIRLNDFPDESLYTLIVNDVEIADFDDWPEQWDRP